jgi:helicase
LIDFYINSKITDINPSQVEAVNKGLLEGTNILAVTLINSEKRSIAELAILKHVLSGGKALYITPYKSLIPENYQYFKKFECMGLKIGSFNGVAHLRGELLASNDIIICTLENMDYMLLNGTMWVNDLSIIVVDEINLLMDPGIGCTMDIMVTKLRSIHKKQMIYLSEPIENAEDIACWLNAELSVCEWRPSFQRDDISFLKIMQFNTNLKVFQEDNKHEIKDISSNLILDTIRQDMQCIVFENVKDNCRYLAQKFSNPQNPQFESINDLLDAETKEKLDNIANSILLFSKRKNSMILANCIRNGVAYYQTDLTDIETYLVASGFNDKHIKVIFATSKLDKKLKANNGKTPYGSHVQTKLIGDQIKDRLASQNPLSLPLTKIIKRESDWYLINNGDTHIPLFAYKQKSKAKNIDVPMAYGYSILLKRNLNDFELLQEKFIYVQTENIDSFMRNMHMLRRHVFGLISSNLAQSPLEITSFFSKTFSVYRGNSPGFVKDILTLLIDHEIVFFNNDRLKITPFGELVSSMYLDPLTAAIIAHNLNIAVLNNMKITEITLLQLICRTMDVRAVDFKNDIELNNFYNCALEHRHEIIDFPSLATIDEAQKEAFLKTVKNAIILQAHINEVDPYIIMKRYFIIEGDLRILALSAAWIAAAIKQIALLKSLQFDFNDLDIRLKYGVSTEHVPLISINSLGRKKIHDLFNAGITSVEILKSSSFEKVEKIIGKKSACKVFDQLNIPTSSDRRRNAHLDSFYS